ncbi:MAG: ABC transporter ATP-binding protein [Akkermansiaceae bacterium]|jgi:capsular polysaccharide transport system ATP-binding protein|nr:ABC transporter ATP-binding protein [Akkermansiaceae bacterium]
MIQLQHVTKFYQTRTGPRYVLKDVSLVIPDRANLAVLGPNGAGKSTFLRMIGGAEMPNSGKIISDVSISWPLGISSGFQGSLSGRSNVLFVCKINGLSLKWCRKVVEDVKMFAELGEYFDMPVASYSSGMRARLSFGLSMAFAFDVYLIDELTSVGDANFRNKAVEAFKELKQRASLIYVSHSLNSLRQTCDSALFLREGNATFYQDIEEGVAAYLKYCADNRKVTPGHKKAAKKVAVGIGLPRSGKKAQKKTARKAGRPTAKKAAKKAAVKVAAKSAGKVVKKAAKKAAAKLARKVARKQAAAAAKRSSESASASKTEANKASPPRKSPKRKVAKGRIAAARKAALRLVSPARRAPAVTRKGI